ncbi:phage tail assembly chaperone G [Anoxybacillus flavithermus]|uniref:phage tail assembly chaperone G n=1 Tax=Anoxybacillus flavithermus TaxID=33934 RepID=UPI0007D8D1F3|nr:hypothetical protein [Anoxybacillus flavithermus]ASA96826.1 hypothetical protein CA592_08400 [Anoxybacillus flavithermus]MBE2912720.1 hypothetical protein [Anoxybacillus flavithermus]MBE2921282.1 hypothetical protein [Anoxybacillus flavithermus]MBE2926711.1 hypothetical protein [Anoxybacillus flavithermus]MBE2937492.1 hypothetical protein [Anoxybacillus flavithermus]
MQVTLLIDGQEKTFTVPFVKARMFRRALELRKKYDFNNIDVEALDSIIAFIVELFNGQFTVDEFYDGIAADRLIPTISDCMNKVIGVAKTNDPNV